MKHFFWTTCRAYSIPLIAGVIAALIFANVMPEQYHNIIHGEWGNTVLSFHWLINDVFMVFFFGIATVDLVDSLSEGGALNPLNKAVAPLMATLGGVLGPVAVFILINILFGSSAYSNGWGVCTATDIALAWFFAKLILGPKHPAVKFLLLLAVVDDAIGLIIIAIFYPQPGKELQLIWLLLIPIAMLMAFIMRKLNIYHFAWYLCCGVVSWLGMFFAGIHPALALVFIIPIMPKKGRFIRNSNEYGLNHRVGNTTLHMFEYTVNPIVDYGLFFFGFVCAGVRFSGITGLTFITLIAFLVGKSGGITLFTAIALKLKAKLPYGMTFSDVIIVSMISGIGLTVALFVAESAFTDAALTDSAKMGALFSVFAAVPAFLTARILSAVKHTTTNPQKNSHEPYIEPAENRKPTILNQKDV